MPEGVPDPTTITDRPGFAQALTQLRERAGLTVRDVARTAGLQASTAGGYFGGRHLPPVATPGTLTSLLESCGVRDPAAQSAWHDALLRVRHAPAARPASATTPYRGLASFQPEDAEWFFGREELVEALCTRVAAAARRLTVGTGRGLVVVVGASGSGKSSLLRAGLIPAVERGAASGLGSPGWSWLLFTPGAEPVAELRRQLSGSGGHGAGGPVTADRDLLVVVDQLEELFTTCTDDAQRRAFVTELLDLGRDRTGRTVVVAGLRADFYGHATRLPGLVGALQDSQLVVGPMTVTQLRRAIAEPARKARVEPEDGLIELVLQALAPTPGVNGGGSGPAAAHEPGALPLLSHALLATWQRGQGTTLRAEDFLAAGGIQGAVAGTAEEVYTQLTPAEQETAARLFRRLVWVGADSGDTRRRVSFAELGLQADGPASPLRTALDQFVAHRLLTTTEDGVEITHDALLVAWPRLRSWVDADRVGLRTHRQLTAAALAWDGGGRDPHALYAGGRLATALEWAADPGHDAELSPVEQAFLTASADRDQAERRREQRTTRRLRWLAGSLVVLLAVAAGLAGYAFRLRDAAARDRDLADSRQVAVQAQRLRTEDPADAAQLAVLAYRTAHSPQAASAVLDAAALPVPTKLSGPPGVLQSVSATVDGKLVAGGGEKGVVRLWSTPAGRRPQKLADLPTETGQTVFATAFAPDGRLLAAAGGDKLIRLWDVTHPDRPRPLGTPLTGAQNTVYGLAFSPNGHVLAAASADRTVQLWNVADPAHAVAFGPPVTAGDEAVQAVAFSPDGGTLAAGGVDRTVRLFTVTDPARPVPVGPPTGIRLAGATSTVFGVAFSPNGQTVAAGTRDGSVLLWNLTGLPRAFPPGPPSVPAATTLSGPGNWVNGVAFSPDGQRLAAASSDGKVWVWEPAQGGAATTLPHPAPVTAVTWRGNGTLFSSCADGSARSWTVPGGPATGLPGPVYGISFSRDGTRLAGTAGGAPAGTAGLSRLWNLSDPARPRRSSPAIGAAPATAPGAATAPAPGTAPAPATAAGLPDGSGAISPDGTLLVTGTRTGTLQFWDVTDPASPRPAAPELTVSTQLVEWVGFAPDGRSLAIGSDDGTVRLVDVADHSHPAVLGAPLTGPANQVFAVTFSADGTRLAAATSNRTVWLWDVRDRRAPKVLAGPVRGPASYVYGVAFSPDGRTLAAGTADHSVWLWDLADPAHPAPIGQPLTGPTNYVYSVAFSPDGTRLAAGAGDHSVWLWDVRDRTRPAPLATLTDPGDAVYAVAFSPDGRTLAAGSGDHSVWLWDVDPQRAVSRICSAAGDPVSPSEWAVSAPGLPYRPVC
ncbi:MAG TPA: helix-turn-helix domain-containing protein [Kineosporiaceae bacterium]|nr:helix-turn-helix domain-containing protein [Kineosporiaceae bacterium]